MSEVTCPACQRGIPNSPVPLAACPYCDTTLMNLPPSESRTTRNAELFLVADRYRTLQWFLLAAFYGQSSLLVMLDSGGRVGLGGGVLIVLFYGFLHWYAGRAMVLLLRALRKSPTAVAVSASLVPVPVVNLAVMAISSSQAATALRKAGLRVGFFGASDQEVMARRNLNLCRQCGYDLTGNVSGRCPECGTTI